MFVLKINKQDVFETITQVYDKFRENIERSNSQFCNTFIFNQKMRFALVNEKIQKLASQIFKVDSLIQHLGLIDLEGHILTDQSSASSVPIEPNEDRIMFYYQVGLRRGRREHFNDVYGTTEYIHIIRKKMQQIVLYLPMITIYLTLDRRMTPNGVGQLAEKINNLDSKLLSDAIHN